MECCGGGNRKSITMRLKWRRIRIEVKKPFQLARLGRSKGGECVVGEDQAVLIFII